MSKSPHDSCSAIEHGSLVESSYVDGSVKSQKAPLDHEKPAEFPKKSNSFDRKLMRDRQAEPRYFVYVYDYSENKTKIMKRRKLLEKRGECYAATLSRHVFAETHL